MTVRKNKAPFPWFGGKSKAAPVVWSMLGDVVHYVEPFAGALGVLLERPHPCNRTYYSETINDLDGFVVNAWRAMQMQPEATAKAASWPVTEADKIARQLACLRWKRDNDLEHLMGDATWCDPVVAGWWLYGVCCQIGAIKGPWIADPVTGRIMKQTGSGGTRRNLPQLSNNGKGVNRPQLREPGVFRDRPHLSNNGNGVNHAGTREPGVSPAEGQPGDCEQAWAPEQEFHPVTMPELVRWFEWLSARLRHVRIVNGQWTRVCTIGAAKTLPVRQKQGVCGIFLDPPYADDVRSSDLYSDGCDSGSVTQAVRDWCIQNGDDKDYRIVLAGFDVEHAELTQHGWTEHEWFAGGFLSGGYGNIDGTSQQHRERLWASPHCLQERKDEQRSLFA